MFDIKEVVLDVERDTLIEFLKDNNLDYEFDINYSILVYDKDILVATASIANNVMKCFLVKDEYKNQNITNMMFHHLVNKLKEKNVYNFFVFTSPENEKIFTSLNMKKIVETMNTVLLEGGDFITEVLHELKLENKLSNNKKACVIINANPMTLGHVYLIEQAAKENQEVLVFVVSEDLSSFPFAHRFEIIQKVCKKYPNVKVLPSLSYLVSKLTFPKYFLREDQLIQEEQTLVDVLVYKQYYTKIFNINRRYLGEEPYSYNTNKYNQTLKNHLGNHIKIVARKEKNNQAISASKVRKLIKLNKIEKIKEYVPKATYEYLQSDKGQEIIKKIQSNQLGRH